VADRRAPDTTFVALILDNWVEDLESEDYPRARELCDQYADADIGLDAIPASSRTEVRNTGSAPRFGIVVCLSRPLDA
jgi:hypothetical protein